MKILIFGANGFVGADIAKYLTERGHQVARVSRSVLPNFISIDIRDSRQFDDLAFEPDVVINCASVVPIQGKISSDPEYLKEMFMTNVIGAVNVANWAVKMKVDRIINCSTLVVVKKPWPQPLVEEHVAIPEGMHAGYCLSKLNQEQLMNECVKGSSTSLTHVRLSAVYGALMKKEGIIFHILNSLKNNQPVTLTNASKVTFDFINVKDVSRSINTIMQCPFQHSMINLASGKQITLLELAETLKSITSSSSRILNSDTDAEPSLSAVDVTKLRQNIGQVYEEFISIREGLKALLTES